MTESPVNVAVARPSAQTLRARIAALNPAQAAGLRQLFGRRRQLPRNGIIALSLLGAPPPALPLVELGGGDETVWLGLADDVLAQPVDGRSWRDFDAGPARNAAWTLAHEPVLDALAALLQLDLLPRGLRDAEPDAGPEDRVWLGFEALQSQPDERVGRGRIGLSATRLQTLADALQRAPDLPIDVRPWLALKLSLRLSMAPLELPLATLRSLRGGDVLVAGHRLAVLDGLVAEIDDGPRFAVSTESGRYRIDRVLQPLPTAESPTSGSEAKEAVAMNDDSEAKPAETVPAAEGPALDAVPVRLEFELGQLSVALGELAALQPGYVFTLPQPVEGSNVTIRANGAAVGRGELVAVGETLGVRLLALGTNGLQ